MLLLVLLVLEYSTGTRVGGASVGRGDSQILYSTSTSTVCIIPVLRHGHSSTCGVFSFAGVTDFYLLHIIL
ncbi:hypothetical protein HOY80DRAFT_990514 [Tuber brumale]|nr:hypothetical protein HOY80DRAFT_990514 [Tuber brumale]